MSIYCHVWVVVIQKKETKLYVLNLDCESVHVLNISALSDTCTLLFPQSGTSPLSSETSQHVQFVLSQKYIEMCGVVSRFCAVSH